MKKGAKMGNGNKSFIQITNKDIFYKIEKLETRLNEIHDENKGAIMSLKSETKAANERLNGRAHLNFWIATTALGFSAGVAGAFLSHIIMGG